MEKLKYLAMMFLAITSVAFTSCSDDDDDNDGGSTLNRFAISQTSLTLAPGETETLTCTFYPENISNKTVTWTTSDEAVATVADGVITAVAPGTATITATPAANPEEAQTCAVTVSMNTVTVNGEVSGTWDAYTTYIVDGQLTVPEGQSLTIEKGAQVVFNGNDGNGAGIEFTVNGSIYCNGTEDAPITFTIPENARTQENWLGATNLWGGFIIASSNESSEAVFNYCNIEYTGSPVTETSPSAINGVYTAGDDYGPQITTGPAFHGKLIVENCVIGNGYSDGIYMQGGQGIIAHNVFYNNGATGGEAVNVKAGTTTTVAYNVMYSPNTNGLKLSSSGEDDAAGRYQSKCVAYNNTIINAGWRRDGEKGGCIYVEKNIRANVFNNLMVNCKFRAMAPSWGTPGIDDGCDINSVIDYNCYVSGDVQSTFSQDQEEGGILYPYAGYNSDNKNYYDAIDSHSIISKSANDVDITFANFPLDNALDNVTFNTAWDFHATEGVADQATDGADLYSLEGVDFVNTGLTVNGQTYKVEAPSKFFGAYAAN